LRDYFIYFSVKAGTEIISSLIAGCSEQKSSIIIIFDRKLKIQVPLTDQVLKAIANIEKKIGQSLKNRFICIIKAIP
jgi:hypothetical protein